MTDINEKIRSLFLTALIVFSVFAGMIGFSGRAAAANLDAGTFYSGQEVSLDLPATQTTKSAPLTTAVTTTESTPFAVQRTPVATASSSSILMAA